MMLPPRSRWRAWIDERLAGSNGLPASTPIGTEIHGGRAVVSPTSPTSVPVAASARTDGSCEKRPWVGPIVTVVYRLQSSIES